MPIGDGQATTIAIACVRKVGGHTDVPDGAPLGSVGVGSTGLISSLVDEICNNTSIGVPSVPGFQIKPNEFSSIKTTSSVTDVANVISDQATSKG
jgi:hypothetical protein